MSGRRYHSYQGNDNRNDESAPYIDDRRVTPSYNVKNEEDNDEAVGVVHFQPNSSAISPNQETPRDLLSGGRISLS